MKRRKATPYPPLAATRSQFITCPMCGKRGFESRKVARGEARRMGDKSMSAYRCRLRPDTDAFAWHVGHTRDADHLTWLRAIDKDSPDNG